MRKITSFIFFIALAIPAWSQVYNAPESVEFDYANNRWFIGNHTGHTILIKNYTTGPLLPFATGLTTGPHGLEIVNDTLYACDGASLRGYNINTAALVFNINMGATFLNGITHDNSGNIYATDYSGSKIYRFNTATRQHNVFVTSPGTNPNGIIYDQPNNRCVYVLWGGGIQAVLLSDSSTSLVLSSTLTSIDGIAKDGAGNYFLSSWGGNKVTRYTNTFTSPTTVVTGLNQPADIFYNVLTDTLAVPNSGATLNNVQFYYFGTASNIVSFNERADEPILFPNPSSGNTFVSFSIEETTTANIILYDLSARIIETLPTKLYTAGRHSVEISLNNLSSGNYILALNSAKGELFRKLLVVK